MKPLELATVAKGSELKCGRSLIFFLILHWYFCRPHFNIIVKKWQTSNTYVTFYLTLLNIIWHYSTLERVFFAYEMNLLTSIDLIRIPNTKMNVNFFQVMFSITYFAQAYLDLWPHRVPQGQLGELQNLPDQAHDNGLRWQHTVCQKKVRKQCRAV